MNTTTSTTKAASATQLAPNIDPAGASYTAPTTGTGYFTFQIRAKGNGSQFVDLYRSREGGEFELLTSCINAAKAAEYGFTEGQFRILTGNWPGTVAPESASAPAALDARGITAAISAADARQAARMATSADYLAPAVPIHFHPVG